METSSICALPDDLLLQILYHVPTKGAIATSILSQRWRYVWTMLPSLEFIDEGISESFGCSIDKSLQLHKAPKLHKLIVELGPHYTVDVDVGEWVENAVNCGVEDLHLNLFWTAEPTRFPKSLYTCETLVKLGLSNLILIDVSFPAHLPSLENLTLEYVIYKDEESLDSLLSSSHVLKRLEVYRHESDNLKNFTVKVSSLEKLYYTSILPRDEVNVDLDVVEEDEVEDGEEDEVEDGEEDEVEDGEEDAVEDGEENEDKLIGSLVIDSPALRSLNLFNVWEGYCLIENMHCLDEATIGYVSNPDVKILRSLSSVIQLALLLNKPMVACCYAIKFSQLIKFCFYPDNLVDWLEPLMFFLQNSPELKSLTIDNRCEGPPPSWNQPSTIPGCLLNHLEFFGWKDYRGRESEKQLLTYILTNSKCLEKVEISFLETSNVEEKKKELESIHKRISTSSRLLFSPRKNWRVED